MRFPIQQVMNPNIREASCLAFLGGMEEIRYSDDCFMVGGHREDIR